MKKSFLCALVLFYSALSSHLFADSTQRQQQQDQLALDLKINHQVLWQSSTSTITSYDLVKQMDLILLHQGKTIPQQLKAEYYRNSWRDVLTNMIERDLVLQEAKDRGFKIERYEVMEEIIRRMGSDYILILDRENIALNDLIEDIEKELLVQRMIYIKVQYKAQRAITPGAIRAKYAQYLSENPETDLVDFHLYTVKASDAFNQTDFFETLGKLQERLRSNGAITQEQVDQISNEGTKVSRLEFKEIKTQQLTPTLLKHLAPLQEKEFTTWKESEDRHIMKILYLLSREQQKPKKLSEMKEPIENSIFESNMQTASQEFLNKLYQQHSEELQELQRRLDQKEINPFG